MSMIFDPRAVNLDGSGRGGAEDDVVKRQPAAVVPYATAATGPTAGQHHRPRRW
jgi:hypothetical protein